MHVRRNVPYEALADYIDGLGTANRVVDRDLSEDLRYIAKLLPQLPHALPTEGACPYCAAVYLVNHYRPELRGTEAVVEHRMRVIKWICKGSDEYNRGYRAVWRCEHCGEIEVR